MEKTSRGVPKPLRSRLPEGGFQCYKCRDSAKADAAVREKCCRVCLLALVKRAFRTQFAKVRSRTLPVIAQRESTSRECEETHADFSRKAPLFFVALSGGDASLSLAELVFEAQRERNSVRTRQAKTERGSSAAREEERAVLIHVDLQRLFVPRVPRLVSQAEATEGGGPARPVVRFFSSSGFESLPLRLKKEAARLWASDVVFIHPSGVEFRIEEDKDGNGFSEEYFEWPASTEEFKTSIIDGEARLRRLLTEASSRNGGEIPHFCQLILFRAISLFLKRRSERERGKNCSEMPTLICFGDTANLAALNILERVTCGEGRILAEEASALDARFEPLFIASRPLIDVSKKEAVLFRVYSKLPSLPTNPFFLSFSASSRSLTSPSSSLRTVLQEYLLDLEKGNPSTVSNILSSVRKLRDVFAGWSDDALPCSVCSRSVAVDCESEAKEDPALFSPEEMEISSQFLSDSSRALCFVCSRYARACREAAELSCLLLSSDVASGTRTFKRDI